MDRKSTFRALASTLCLALAVLCCPAAAHADSVAQIATGVRISRNTATLIDPQGRPGGASTGTDTVVQAGDVLTFVAHFTPVPNGGIRGLGGYVTVYIPRNTEVVGVRIIDQDGNTIAPRRAGFASDGAGPRGASNYALPLVAGSLAQLYADTGVFFSTDPRTARVPDGSQAGEAFVTIFNGIVMDPEPTAAGKLGGILGTGATLYCHNQWDWIQALAFGVGDGMSINTRGQGDTPDMYGSPVAGPQTFYDLEASYSGDLGMAITVDGVVASDTVGPWQRIQTFGAEMGRRGNLPPMPDPGEATRLGVPAQDGAGVPLGVVLDPGQPLPAYDAGAPSAPHVRALRYAVGELLVGVEYLSEFSLRVLDTPLDPVSGKDVVCAEVFGGDASAEELDGSKDGKDNAWRYFMPAPACVSLNLLFDLDVDRPAVLQGEPLEYVLEGKNLSTEAHTDVQVRHCYVAGDLAFVAASGGGVDQAATGCPASHDREVLWTIARWEPGAEFSHSVSFTATGGPDTIGRAVFTSTELPAPGFSTVAYTVIDNISIVQTDLSVSPQYVASKPASVSYSATVGNSGTGTADLDNVVVVLPAGFVYSTSSAAIDGVAVADPDIQGTTLTFSAGFPSLEAGATIELTFDVEISAGATDGAQVAQLDVRFTDPFKGEKINDSRIGVAHLAVVTPRSAVPVVEGALAAGSTLVRGTTTEAEGTTIRVFVSGLQVATGSSDANGDWMAAVPALFGGQRVSASAEASGKLESLRSDEVSVLSVAGGAACSDGIDNDGDGLIDFPDDPDCFSAVDVDEALTPACADGVDNDGDGTIDFGDDLSCSSLLDDDESGMPACSDGIDNDGDGASDFPKDPGCASADDVNETDVPACADGLDNDGDGTVDFPRDDGCQSALDEDERAAADDGSAGDGTGGATDGMGSGGPGAGGAPADGDDGMSVGPGDGGIADGMGDASAAMREDPGGIEAPGAGGGCGCRIGDSRDGHGRQGTAAGAASAALLGLLWMRRRRRGSHPETETTVL